MGPWRELADVAILIDAPPELKTPLVESFQAVVWHALVSHPELAAQLGHWEGLGAADTLVEPAPGRIPGPRRRPQRPRPGPRLRSLRSRRCGAEDVRLLPGAAAAARRAGGCGIRARRRLQPARRGQGDGHARAAARDPERVLELLARRGRAIRRLLPLPASPGRRSVADLRGPCDCRKPAPGMLLEAAAELRARPRRARGWSATPTPTSAPAGQLDAGRSSWRTRAATTSAAADSRRRVADLATALRRSSAAVKACSGRHTVAIAEGYVASKGGRHDRRHLHPDLRRRRRSRRDPGSRRRPAHRRASRRTRP